MSEKELNKTIAENLCYLLEKTGKTQAQLADYMDLSQATISNWCNGIKMPRMDKIDKICTFLNASRNDLMLDREVNKEYYERKETNEIAEAIFNSKELRLLFSVGKDSTPENLIVASDLLLSLKKKEQKKDD